MKWQIITPKEPEPAHLNAYALLPEKYVWYTVQQMPDETFAVVRHTELRRFIDDVATGINIAEEDKIAELAKQEEEIRRQAAEKASREASAENAAIEAMTDEQ